MYPFAMHPYLIKGASLGPAAIRNLVEAIPDSEYDNPTGEDRFSVREVIAHLADWEVLFRRRMEDALETPGIAIEVYDEGDRAIELKYAETDLADQLNRFVVERSKTVALLSPLTPEQLRIQYRHPKHGLMAIEDQANMLIGHDMYHAEQLSEVLARCLKAV